MNQVAKRFETGCSGTGVPSEATSGDQRMEKKATTAGASGQFTAPCCNLTPVHQPRLGFVIVCKFQICILPAVKGSSAGVVPSRLDRTVVKIQECERTQKIWSPFPAVSS